MNENKSFAICICTLIVSFFLLIITICINFTIRDYYERDFKVRMAQAGYQEVQVYGTSSPLWQKVK